MLSDRLVLAAHDGRWFVVCLSAALVALALVAGIQGCSSGGSPGPDGPPAPGDTLYVDPSFAGEEHGTQANPFNTIGEALAAADHGYLIVLAAGDYGDQADIEVDHAVEIAGAGAGATVFGVGFALAPDVREPPVVIRDLSCETIHTLTDTVSASRCAYEIRDCAMISFADTLGSVDTLHYRLLDGCHILGNLDLAGGSLRAGARLTVRDCWVGGSLFVGGATVGEACVVRGCTVGGDATIRGVSVKDTLSLESCVIGGDASVRSTALDQEQRIVDCTIAGSARLLSVSAHGMRASENEILGDSLIVAGASVSSCTVVENHLAAGSVRVQAVALVGEVSRNLLDDGGIRVVGTSARVPVEDNTVTRSTGGNGIDIKAVAFSQPVRGNTVTVPYSAPTGSPVQLDTLAVKGICVNAVAAAGGVRSNHVSGGAYGIYLRTVAGACCGNDVEGAHVGIAVCGVSAAVDSNDVRDCAGDGIGLFVGGEDGGDPADTWLSLQANTIANNGGSGILVATNSDLGGAPHRAAVRGNRTEGFGSRAGRLTSEGLNVVTGNGSWDLAVATQAAEVDTVWALWNTWDHADSVSIGVFDIYDIDDDPSLSRVIFWPVRGR